MTFDDTSNTPHAVPQALPRTAPNQHQEQANQPRHHHQPLVLLGNTPGSCLGSEPISLINCGSYGGCVLQVLLLGVLPLKSVNSMQAYIFWNERTKKSDLLAPALQRSLRKENARNGHLQAYLAHATAKKQHSDSSITWHRIIVQPFKQIGQSQSESLHHKSNVCSMDFRYFYPEAEPGFTNHTEPRTNQLLISMRSLTFSMIGQSWLLEIEGVQEQLVYISLPVWNGSLVSCSVSFLLLRLFKMLRLSKACPSMRTWALLQSRNLVDVQRRLVPAPSPLRRKAWKEVPFRKHGYK